MSQDVVALTAALIDIPSESGSEATLADLVEATLSIMPGLEVRRLGNTVVASTSLGRAHRVVIGGHLDTVPGAGNWPHRMDGDRLVGLGAVDMKGGLAIALRLASGAASPVHDVTYLFYDEEEVETSRSGLVAVGKAHPEWLRGDFAILMEPSNARVEAGCQGTVRVELTTVGKRAHSARPWMGANAIHGAADILNTLVSYEPERITVDGLEYREAMSAVAIRGGVAGNVIPDTCVVTVNYRFAPTRTEEQAVEHLREVFGQLSLRVVDSAPAAMPGLSQPIAESFVAATGVPPAPKYGWTDVARFAALGIPAVNYGPGDPALAHSPDEFVRVGQLRGCEQVLRAWLTAA